MEDKNNNTVVILEEGDDIFEGSSFSEEVDGMDFLGDMEDDFDFITGLEYEEDPFGGKLYIKYIGLNPLSVFFTEDVVLLDIIQKNYDHNKFKFLIKNLKEFTEGCNYRNYHLKKSELEDKSELTKMNAVRRERIIEAMEYKIETLEQLRDTMYTVEKEVDGTARNQKTNQMTIRGVVMDRAFRNTLLHDVFVYRTNTEKTSGEDMEERLNGIVEQINSYISMMKKIATNEMNNSTQGIDRYMEGTQIQIQDADRQLFKDLGFPMMFEGNQHLFTNNIRTERAAKDRDMMIIPDMEKYHQGIFELYNLRDGVENNYDSRTFFKIDN